MHFPPWIAQDLDKWRKESSGIGKALAAGLAADWPAARASHNAVLLELGRAPEGVGFSTADLDGVSAVVAVPDVALPSRRVLYFHGGGYCSGSAAAFRNLAGQLARRLQARVYVADYRLAPQHPYPAQMLDAVTAYRWLLAQPGEPDAIALAGDSAGGAMILTLMRRARDAGLTPPVAGVAISPWANLVHDAASMHDRARQDPLVQVEYLERLAAAFAPDTPRDHPDISPVNADLHDLSPVLILAGEREIMLSDAIRLAGRLAEARVRVSLEVWPGMFHIWPIFAGRLQEADEALDHAAAFLDAAFARRITHRTHPLQERTMSQSKPSTNGSPITRHNPSTIWDSTANGHSQISVAEPGRLAFLSGQIGVPPDGGASPGDLAGQARVVAGNLAAALKELGASPRDVVQLRLYVVNATKERFGEAWSPIKEMIGSELPSVTAIGVQALYTSDLQLEVEMVVRAP